MRIQAQYQVAPEVESLVKKEELHKQILHNLGASITEHVVEFADWKTHTDGPLHGTVHTMGGHFFGMVEFRKIRSKIRDIIHDNKVSIKDKWSEIEALLGDTRCKTYQQSAVKREQRVNELKRVNVELNRLNKKRAEMNNTQAESIRELQGELSNTKKEFDESLCRLAHTEFQLKEAQGKISLQENCITTMQADMQNSQAIKLETEMISAAIQFVGPELAVHNGQRAYIEQLEKEKENLEKRLQTALDSHKHVEKLYHDERDKVLQLTDESPNLKNGTMTEYFRAQCVLQEKQMEEMMASQKSASKRIIELEKLLEDNAREHMNLVKEDSRKDMDILDYKEKIKTLESELVVQMLDKAATDSNVEKRVGTIEAFLMKNNFWSWPRFIAKYGKK